MWHPGIIVMSMLLISNLRAVEESNQQEKVEVKIATVTGTRDTKMGILIVTPLLTPSMHGLLKHLKADLERSGQCTVALKECEFPVKNSDIISLGYPFDLFMNESADKQQLEGRLYNGLDASVLLSKRWSKRATDRLWSRAVAQDLWMQLMGNAGIFFANVTYVKRSPGRRNGRSICSVDYDGNEEVLRSSSSIMTAPCFSQDGQILFFSEFTDRNVRLMAMDRAKNCWVVVDGDGTYVGVSCAAGSRDIVYCRSGDIWRYQYDAEKKQGAHSLLIQDDGTCASPTLLANGDILYCARGKIKLWSASKKKSEALTKSGYCTGPAYQAMTEKIVYSQRVGKWMQLYTYDKRTQLHQQISSGPGDKIDPSWSPCGIYVTYCLDQGKTSEVMVMNTIQNDVQRISKQGDFCSCPVWSPPLV